MVSIQFRVYSISLVSLYTATPQIKNIILFKNILDTETVTSGQCLKVQTYFVILYRFVKVLLLF